MGFSEADLADGGTDAVIDARYSWGDPETIAARIHDHLERLAPALAGLAARA